MVAAALNLFLTGSQFITGKLAYLKDPKGCLLPVVMQISRYDALLVNGSTAFRFL